MKDSSLERDEELLEKSSPSTEEKSVSEEKTVSEEEQAPEAEQEKKAATRTRKKKKIEKPKELEEQRLKELEEEEEEVNDIPQGGRMSLLSHLGELRKRLFIIVIFFLVAVLASFTKSEWFCNLLLNRASQFTFVYIRPAELLMAYVRIALIVGLVFSVPVIIMQLWLFVRPGLRKREQVAFFGVMLTGVFLFCLGVFFSYEIVLPILLDFFARLETADTVSAMVSVEEYLNYVTSTMVMFGVIFETPIVLISLTATGLVNPKFLQRNFKYIILIVLIIAAIITPPDVTSQVLVAVPLLILFYASILLCNIIFRRKLAKKAAEEAEMEQF